MDNILKTMIQLWNIKNIDWLGYENEDRYSFHHLFTKKCNGGERIVNNGAVLHIHSHEYLHTIEHYDLDKYIFLNNILKEVNKQRYMATKEQLEQIKYVLLEFQKEYEGKTNSRDKPIIKKEYRLEE